MLKWFKFIPEVRLTPNQWRVLASAISNISQGVILFSFAAFFVPQAVSLPENFSKEFAIRFFGGGLILLISAIMMSRSKD